MDPYKFIQGDRFSRSYRGAVLKITPDMAASAGRVLMVCRDDLGLDEQDVLIPALCIGMTSSQRQVVVELDIDEIDAFARYLVVTRTQGDRLISSRLSPSVTVFFFPEFRDDNAFTWARQEDATLLRVILAAGQARAQLRWGRESCSWRAPSLAVSAADGDMRAVTPTDEDARLPTLTDILDQGHTPYIAAMVDLKAEFELAWPDLKTPQVCTENEAPLQDFLTFENIRLMVDGLLEARIPLRPKQARCFLAAMVHEAEMTRARHREMTRGMGAEVRRQAAKQELDAAKLARAAWTATVRTMGA